MAKYVEFYDFSSGDQEVIGRARLLGGRIVYEGLPKGLIRELEAGIRVSSPDGPVMIRPDQPQKFLDGLSEAYSGSMLRASDPIEE